MIFETGGGEVTADPSVKVVAPIMGEREAYHMEDTILCAIGHVCGRWNVPGVDNRTQTVLRHGQ
eukprot:10285912-Karenia_brevis.AAC.1